MNYGDPKLRDMLAAEYVLGTLRGRARRRFERLLREDVALREVVAVWERRLTPLAEAIEPVAPPRRVWREIERRIAPGTRASVWNRAGFWRSLALVASVVAIFLATQIYRVETPVPPPVQTAGYVAVLSDQSAQPVWLVSAADTNRITVKVQTPPPIDEDRAYELWLLPGDGQPPRSLGLLPTSGSLTVSIPPELQTAMAAGKTLAVSVEPRGGSPTGLPTGPVLYQGTLLTTG